MKGAAAGLAEAWREMICSRGMDAGAPSRVIVLRPVVVGGGAKPANDGGREIPAVARTAAAARPR